MPSAAAAPPPGAEVAGPPRTELEELQIKANQVTDDVNFYNMYLFILRFTCQVWPVEIEQFIRSTIVL